MGRGIWGLYVGRHRLQRCSAEKREHEAESDVSESPMRTRFRGSESALDPRSLGDGCVEVESAEQHMSNVADTRTKLITTDTQDSE